MAAQQLEYWGVRSTKGEILSATHHSLWRTCGRWDLPRRARRARGGAAPRSRHLAPTTQRRGRLHLRGLGVIYAVLIALVVIAVWEEYDAASVTVEQEANAVAEIFWLA